jgi:hypothetical protein
MSLWFFKQDAQNGRGAKRSAERASVFLPSLAPRLRALCARIRNAFRSDSLSGEILEEYEAHIADAVADGLHPAEARRQFGRPLRLLEASRDFRIVPWLDSLRGDVVFAWRQLKKNKATSLAAVLSIGLAMGACASAFRLIDALLLRPMPVAHPERLFVVSFDVNIPPDGKLLTDDSCAYPMFRQMRALVKDQAELVAISYVSRVDLTFSNAEQMEKANQQYVSGWMFSAFGLHPELGRVFSEDDDKTPGAHPLAVLSYDYWQSRFGGDRDVVGRSFRIGNDSYQIIGVAQKPFIGTETGTVVDIFLPTMMMKQRDCQGRLPLVSNIREIESRRCAENLARPVGLGFSRLFAGIRENIPYPRPRRKESLLKPKAGSQFRGAGRIEIASRLWAFALRACCAGVAGARHCLFECRQLDRRECNGALA